MGRAGVGRQPHRDPDAADLVDFRDGTRTYRGTDGSEFVKRLRDDEWV